MQTIIKTSFLALLMLFPACKEEEQKEDIKEDYSSLFNYNVSLWVNNMTDQDINLELVYFGYRKETVKANQAFFKTKVNALELLQYFNVDMSDPYLSSGEIRYFYSCDKEILKYGWLNRETNLSDNIIRKDKTGNFIIEGSGDTHLD